MSRLRTRVALVGIALAVIALWRDDRRITWASIAVLGIALAMRFLGSRGRTTPPVD
ncbi:MAG: hypothetical protein V4503_00800 [Gemmatimonadota bacterium]